jgi:hypothetical protein
MGDILTKIFETIGFISLVFFSFFYTNKISTVIKENDDILKQINLVKEQYEIKPISATINEEDIIPGIKGSSIDVAKSYNKMKKLNTFNPNLLVYKDILPTVSVNKVYDKYIISGNLNKKEVTINFLLEDNENIENILNILNKYNIKANFFVTIKWFSNNNEKITYLINNEHIVGSILYKDDSLKNNINWMNAIVSKINKQNNTYCYNNTKNSEFLNLCKLNTSYTITPSIEAFDNPFIQIKTNIKNGSIISLKVNDKTISELPLIIEYINSKGFDIVSLFKLIEE